MNRRDAGYALIGTLGALAGAGCAAPLASRALPSGQAQNLVKSALCTDLPIVMPESLYLRFGKQYLKLVGGPYTVTSSKTSVKATVSGEKLTIDVQSPSTDAEISVVDNATGATTKFRVITGPF
jgi:hypothetical protein